MNATLFITQRELSNYFNSLTAYIVVILFLLITGGMFWIDFFQGFPELSLRKFFSDAPLFLAFFAPAITMGLVAEEKRSGTLELMMTMPVSDTQIVLGKFLAAVVLLVVTFLFTFPYALSLSTMGKLDWGPVIGGYAGLILLGSAYASVGIMVSAWTKDQIVSILLGFFICFLLFIIDRLMGNASGTVAVLFEQLSSSHHFQNIARGVIELKDVVYYLSVIVICLMTAQATLASRRW
ncbi:MAG: ABC transporter permease subunit [Myxococcota bacterium]